MGGFLASDLACLSPPFCPWFFLAACQPQQGRVNLQPDENFVISRGTWEYFETYLQTIGTTNRGAFAVSEDGYYATYHYCATPQGCFTNINYSNRSDQKLSVEGLQMHRLCKGR